MLLQALTMTGSFSACLAFLRQYGEEQSRMRKVVYGEAAARQKLERMSLNGPSHSHQH